MEVTRAVITAAAPAQSALPLQTVVDRNGNDKTALELILDETVEAGIEEICLVICPGQKDNYTRAAGTWASRVTFVEQDNPRGYGDALWRAAEFVNGQPFLHLVGDHLYMSNTGVGCARQLVERAKSESCSVSAVQATRENMLPYFGTVGARRVTGTHRLYEIDKVVEKPTPTQAEQDLVVAGLRSSHYLCLFGMHVLTPALMELLDQSLKETGDDPTVLLSPSLAELAKQERYLAFEIQGSRHNIGIKYGLLMAQLALALSGSDRDLILTRLVEMLAANQTPNREAF